MYRVMIADDEELMREAMRIMVSDVSGFTVVRTVANGEDAVEVCKTEKIDIVFMDIMMPGISGIEASKQIYTSNHSITIYIVSAYNNFEFAREALKAEVREYISKPVTGTLIKSLLDGYSESHKKYGKQADSLFSILKEKNLKKMYYRITQIVNEIYSDTGGDTEQLKATFMKLGQSLMSTLDWLNEKQIKCEELFPMTEVLLSEKKSLEFWLFNVMNYIFQQVSIKKYQVLESVFRYIDENIKKDIGLNQIVDHCNISQGYLSRIFMQQMGVSVIEYLHMRKLTIAKGYFSFTDLNIIDVAFRLGYNESSYFSKVFKKYEHVTVFQYKKSLALEQDNALKSR